MGKIQLIIVRADQYSLKYLLLSALFKELRSTKYIIIVLASNISK